MHKYNEKTPFEVPQESVPTRETIKWSITGPGFVEGEEARKNDASSDELQMYTIDVKPGDVERQKKVKKARSSCKQVGFSLSSRASIRKELYPLQKTGEKIKNCALSGVYPHLTPTVNYRTGTALCKQRFCPNCQRVLSAKRKDNFLTWFELNRKTLRKYFFYHVVFTVRHSKDEDLRDYLYTSELLQNFAELRGTKKKMGSRERKGAATWWKSWIAGGSYYCELAPGADGTPHIHLHCIVLAKKQLWNAKQKAVFITEAEERWGKITHNDKLFKGVFVDPVYYIDSTTNKRVNCHFGSSVMLEKAVSEAIKYTIKSDVDSLNLFTDEILCDVVTTKNRYYGRFGCLNKKDASSKVFDKLDLLCTDYQDLEQMKLIEAARLLNPETGEMVEKDSTRIIVTPNRNMKANQVAARVAEEPLMPGLEGPAEPKYPAQMAYALDDMPVGGCLWFESWESDKAAIALCTTLVASYQEEYEPDYENDTVLEETIAPKQTSIPLNPTQALRYAYIFYDYRQADKYFTGVVLQDWPQGIPTDSPIAGPIRPAATITPAPSRFLVRAS